MHTANDVILLHGLWMGPASMTLLSRRLQRAGFRVQRMGYESVQGGPERAIPELARRARGTPCHVVAHSLGGLIALTALEQHPELPVRRVVCLGSPLCGSAVADRMAQWPVLGASLGRSASVLRRGCRPWAGRAQVGMVAGRRRMGLGQVIAQLAGEHDGTVAVEETRLPGLTDHTVIDASHSGLLFSADAAQRSIAFLRHGRFAG